MATNQPARHGAGESMAEFVRRRNLEQAARDQARAAGHNAYGEAIRAGQDLELKKPGDVAAHGAKANGAEATPDSAANYPILEPNFDEFPAAPVSHPGPFESWVPVWGSVREGLADFTARKPVSGVFNLGLAALDATGVGMARKLLAKGGAYALRGPLFRDAAETEWPHVRDQMRAAGLLKKVGRRYQEGHHWLIAQRHDWVPNFIRNHPANIHGMETATHARLRHSYKGQPRFGPLEHYWRGTPHWSKVATGSVAGHTVVAAEAKDRRR